MSAAPTYLTAREVAERLRISPTTVYALCYAGELEYCRFGTGKSNKRLRIVAASVAAYELRCRELPVEAEQPKRRKEVAFRGLEKLKQFGWQAPAGMKVVG
jgi:excisionase family DNA binding protein